MEWIAYTSSGVHTNTFTDANGCDSIVTVDLTVNYGSSTLLTHTNCGSYTWDGIVFDSTGIYTKIFRCKWL